MKRLRFFRILLPAILVPFLVLVGLELRKRIDPWSPPVGRTEEGTSAQGIKFTDHDGEKQTFTIEAESYSDIGDGTQRLQGVRPLTVYRDSGEPLVISADFADWEGEPGARFVRVEGGIEVREEADGLLVNIPVLEIDEASAEARSLGGVRFEAPGMTGTAASVIYPLDDRPTMFRDLAVTMSDRYRLRSETATLVEGSDEILLEGGVRLLGPDMELECAVLRIFRDDEGNLQRVLAVGGVEAGALLKENSNARMKSGSLELSWSEAGEIDFLLMDQDVILQVDEQGLAARMVRVSNRKRQDERWDFLAAGGVYLEGLSRDGKVSLQSSRLEGVLESDGKLKDADVTGSIRFTGPETMAEADSARIEKSEAQYAIALHSSPALRARVSSARHRITGQNIHLRSGSQYILAEGRVEATLLPESGDSTKDAGMFRKGEAVHFVAREMHGSPDGETIRFTGDVRGWQGERTLSADSVQLKKAGGDLLAEGKVGTRLPGRRADSLADADFIHISGDSLVYSQQSATAVYTGNVHVRQAEGWLTTERLEAELQKDDSDLEVLRAIGNVVLEYRARSESGGTEQVQGDSDRAEYTPADAVVRLFGERKRATLRRSGPEAVSIFGRILRYYLDEGTIEVEKGLSGRTRIQTPEGGQEEPSGG
ncbi:MAG: hypothetical protein IFK94_01165 [Acidobacteria bacterium]|uniref:Organic solvent tolerance-like N-terminal domain-containing protein n=1 Tax=Candidatus Polarisedimenticola svalbardensis TaxID=2886004 RepID=A0A8J6Y000_9BACT|nr:hypothetical protein [Candidatus Polarisedimenticola svalbardensis]